VQLFGLRKLSGLSRKHRGHARMQTHDHSQQTEQAGSTQRRQKLAQAAWVPMTAQGRATGAKVQSHKMLPMRLPLLRTRQRSCAPFMRALAGHVSTAHSHNQSHDRMSHRAVASRQAYCSNA